MEENNREKVTIKEKTYYAFMLILIIGGCLGLIVMPILVLAWVFYQRHSHVCWSVGIDN